MKRVLYMHTLGGRPSSFCGDQICFVNPRRLAKLVPDLRQIKIEQNMSVKWRKSRGYPDSPMVYGWIRVEIPAK